jgi:hypothetical protein
MPLCSDDGVFLFLDAKWLHAGYHDMSYPSTKLVHEEQEGHKYVYIMAAFYANSKGPLLHDVALKSEGPEYSSILHTILL